VKEDEMGMASNKKGGEEKCMYHFVEKARRKETTRKTLT
jgi:hypothetical protein